MTLLPNCSARATRETIDVLRLRGATATPGRAYQGAPFAPGDPALLEDTWAWSALSADLGIVNRSVRLCVGLQSGAGAEEVYVDAMRLSPSQSASREQCVASAGGTNHFLAAMATEIARASARDAGACDPDAAIGQEDGASDSLLFAGIGIGILVAAAVPVVLLAVRRGKRAAAAAAAAKKPATVEVGAGPLVDGTSSTHGSTVEVVEMVV